MNANTIVALFGGTGRNQIAAQAATTTVDTVFLVNTDTGTAPAVLSLPISTAIVGSSTPLNPNSNPALIANTGYLYGQPRGQNAPYFNSTSFNGQPFNVRINGTFTSAVAANDLKISLWLGSSATTGSDSIVSAALTTGTSANFGAVSGHFSASFKLQWDVTTGKLGGVIESSFIEPSAVAATVVGGTAVTETSAAAVSNIQFVASAKWNASNAGNTVNITEFSISLI